MTTHIFYSLWLIPILLLGCTSSKSHPTDLDHSNAEVIAPTGDPLAVRDGVESEEREDSSPMRASDPVPPSEDMMSDVTSRPRDEPIDDPMGDPLTPPTEVPPPEPPASTPPQDPPAETCQTHEEFFLDQVWRPVLRTQCLDCHNAQGAAQGTDMVYVTDQQPRALETNYNIFKEIASFDRNGEPVILLKPTGTLSHGGGQLFEVDSPAYLALSTMVDRARSDEEVLCEEGLIDEEDLFEHVELLGAHETLRRATLSLNGRLPSPEEESLVEEYGWDGVEVGIDRIMQAPAFYTRLKELWNDILLTDKYLNRSNAIDLLSTDQYPHARWMSDGEGVDRQGEAYWAALDFSNDSLAREVLEHIAFVVRQERPFTEIITADYIAMNPFTAKLYGVDDIVWGDPLDPQEFKPGRIPRTPHAGILSSPMFLNRYPTTDTNRNRHRARVFYKLFLDLNVFKIAERPIDPTSTAHNPTMNDPQCSICHTTVDPVAGSFQHWDARGGFVFRDTWYGDMRAPGFERELLPYSERSASLSWLAHRAAETESFDRSIVRLMYHALIGDELLESPLGGEMLLERQEAFDAQQRFVTRVATGFRINRHDLKWLIKALIRSPYFRASSVRLNEDEFSEELKTSLGHLGLAQPLTPEQLHRKIYAVTGVRWRPNVTQLDYLLDRNAYTLLYGGIDSDDVVERIREPNGIFANIQRRMANEVACLVTAYDFTRPADARFMFSLIEPSYVPEDVNEFPIPQATQRIRQTLQHLAWRFWGERWADDSSELEEMETVFMDIWQMGTIALADGRQSSNLHWGCQGRRDQQTGEDLPTEDRVVADPTYTIRTWQAILTLFLNDYAFLYE